MVPSVKQVVPDDDYLLSIVFDNGERGTLDMKPFLDFGLFRQLKDPVLFRQVKVSFDTIAWDSGVDLDPEFVYQKCSGLHAKKQNDPAGTRASHG